MVDSTIYRWEWMAILNQRILDDYFEERNESDNPNYLFGSVEMTDGSFIEVEVRNGCDVSIMFYHKDSLCDRPLPNLEQYIMDSLYTEDEMREEWDDSWPKDEWQAHGFRNEADYWHYRLG